MTTKDVWGTVTRASYKRAAADYQHCFTQKTEWQMAERVKFAVLVKANSSFCRPPIIDLGCGDGKDLVIFWGLGLFPIGLDYAEEMLEIAKKKCPQASLFQADMREPLSFINDRGVGGAWTCSTLPHIPKPELPGVLEEVNRILVDGGIFFVSVRAGEAGLYEIPYLAVQVYREKYTEKELGYYLGESGFSILDSKTTETKSDSYPTIFARKDGQLGTNQ